MHMFLFLSQHRGNTALHFASAYGYSSLAKWLIEKGADDSIMNFSGLTCYDGVG
jgi:ankyrin repeat protein